MRIPALAPLIIGASIRIDACGRPGTKDRLRVVLRVFRGVGGCEADRAGRSKLANHLLSGMARLSIKDDIVAELAELADSAAIMGSSPQRGIAEEGRKIA